MWTNISIHALREEGDEQLRMASNQGAISIHALREEGDDYASKVKHAQRISIHALREEGDLMHRESST